MDDELLQTLLAIHNPEGKAALIAERFFHGLSEEAAFVARGCALFHWFDQTMVEDLLQGIHAEGDGENIYHQILSFPFCERLPWGQRYQDLTRQGLLRRYATTQPELLQQAGLYAARAYERRQDDKNVAAELFFCSLVGGDVVSATKHLHDLQEKAYRRQDWQYLSALFELQEEAEQIPFVSPVPLQEEDWLLRGLVHRALGKRERAVRDYGKALETNSQSIAAYIHRGTVYAEQKRYQQALTDFNTALELDATNVQAYVNRGMVYAEQERYQDALHDLDAVLQLDPTNTYALGIRGDVLVERLQYEEAIVAYEQALALGAESAALYKGKADALYALGEYEQALANYEKASGLDASDLEIDRGKSRALYGLKRYAEASALFEQVRQQSTQHDLAYEHVTRLPQKTLVTSRKRVNKPPLFRTRVLVFVNPLAAVLLVGLLITTFVLVLKHQSTIVGGNPLQISTDHLDFGNLAAGSVKTLSLKLSNVNRQAITWQADNRGAAWLKLGKDAGTVDQRSQQMLNVTVITRQLSPRASPYETTLLLTSNGESYRVRITVVVIQSPSACISVDVTNLTFAGAAGISDPTASQQVTLANCGTNNGDWSSAVAYDDTSSSWLSSGTGASLNSGATQAVKVTASNLTAQLAAGTYKGHITYTITTGTGTQAVTVGVTLMVYAAPCITVSPTTFTFSGVVNTSDPAAQTETLTNCGEDGTWSATVSSAAASWLSLDTTSGSLSAGGTQTLTVTVSNLSAGTYTGTLIYTITTAHGTARTIANVTLTVYNPPCFQFTQINGQTASNATTDAITFSAVAGQSNPSDQAVTLNNCGSDSGTWSVSVASGSSWLSAGSTSGSLSGSTSQDVTISAANQSAGTYTGQIVFTLTTPGGTASIALNVTLTVLPGPCVQVTSPSSGSLSFSGSARTGATNSQTVTISNCGAGGTWSVVAATTDGASWLSALTSSQSTSGTLSAGSSVDLAAWADSSSLTAGTYTGTLTFTMTAGNGTGSSTAQVSVTFAVR